MLLGMPSAIFGGGEFFAKMMMFSLLTGAGMVIATLVFGSESIQHAQQCRNAGKPFHSRSRGVERWGSMTPLVILGISVILLVNPVTLVAWIAALAFASKLAGEQQAAIFSRYLDAVDQKIENEHLEAAILGEFPIEQTFLHKALSSNIPAELRKDMAAAAVGKPVKFMARAPQAKTQPGPSTANVRPEPSSSNPEPGVSPLPPKLD